MAPAQPPHTLPVPHLATPANPRQRRSGSDRRPQRRDSRRLPQSIAYALIAGLPPEYGLYAAIIPVLIACLWGSSLAF